ncbi:hypothetical protein FEM48_ZijujUnG0016300 [Ziziphus jujuba var. spinosa]|uniref:Uncharacterized protein n=1 Tax=Ziziphus jujuba var. spinosa TaxID=714518 RepID=A0A978U9V6_ZIZJJ|nr:hypothetical protein FEM48_ZijujUnG0016300 [Ziziphus jujuba var. spinosa]
MCKYVVEAANPSLIGVRTKNTDTALFIAAINGNKEAFLYLHSVCSATSDSNLPNYHHYSYTRRSNSDLAYQIIHLYGDLVNSVNKKGLTPFHAKSSAFKSCSYNLGLWKRLIYQCIVVKELKFEDRKNVGSKLKLKNEQEGSSTSDVEIPIGNEDIVSQSTIPSNEMQGIFPASFDKFVKVLERIQMRTMYYMLSTKYNENRLAHSWGCSTNAMGNQMVEDLLKEEEIGSSKPLNLANRCVDFATTASSPEYSRHKWQTHIRKTTGIPGLFHLIAHRALFRIHGWLCSWLSSRPDFRKKISLGGLP